MTLITRDEEVDAGDADAIAALHRALDAQRAAFQQHPYPSRGERQGHLEALAGMMMSNRQRIREAMSADFAVHPELFSDLIECVGIPSRAMYAISQLDKWMADEERDTDPALFGSARASVRYQPKGVIGNIVPWNFPFDLGVGPLVEMLAAGNRVIVKPSDFTPACGELLADMLGATFDADHITVSLGGLELARTFPTLRWDHLLYTGSPAIGRVIAKAAAENLVPTTLELGGKCPAIILDDAVDMATVANVVGTKMVKNGQMCISVDYVLVPRQHMTNFVTMSQQYVRENTPQYSRSSDCTGIITTRHLDRLIKLRDEAGDAGYEVVELEEGGELNRETRQMPLALVVDPGEELGVMREEIFGPLLPVKPYDSLDEALDYVNSGERPLGLYVFGHDEAQTERVLQQTTSGGACVNVCAMQGALPSLGFGGIGNSGMGRHHGIDGFREFSNPRGVVVRGDNDLVDAFYPPYGDRLGAIMDAAFGQAPGSV
ncbi:MAG: aldehyde dehydrogenase family protein [Actinomycetota bacterium]|nr:aldehyde dehydrogenase family protein [Actinomycetota bacterium]